ncbi:TPA: NUDIX domain-containing protein [Candidatus Woesearchaeota archaeon]|nr:NUDIX domain-containing protein [Candidatus Woesearchaeota archaeon]
MHNIVERQFLHRIRELDKQLPHFSDGRIDYTGARIAPVLNCYIRHDDRLLVLKRSDKVSFLKGRWHVIAGYLDEIKTVEDKAIEELGEETGILRAHVSSVQLHEPYVAHSHNTDWEVYPVLIDVRTADVTLDWEHSEYAWIRADEIDAYGMEPNIARYAKKFFG